MTPRRRLLSYALRYRRAFILGFLTAVASTAILLTGPWLLKYVIDDLSREATLGKVRGYAVLLFGLAAIGGLFRFLTRRIVISASRDLEYDLRNDFFAHLQRMDLAYFHRSRTGDLMSRATNDLSAVRMMIGPAVMYATTTGLTFVVALTIMVTLDPWLTAIALLPLPFVSLAVRYFGDAIHRRFEKIQEQLSDISAVTQESLSGVRVVRAYRQERYEIARFAEANLEYLRRNRALIYLQGAYYPTMGLFMGLGALLVLWLGSRRVVAGTMTVGELVAFNGYLVMLGWPMVAFGWVTNLLQRGMASWKRMLEVLDAVPAITDDDVTGELDAVSRVSGAIEFRNLSFAYGDRVVLRNISAVIPAGTTTAIVGATGSGKSTLLNLLPRLYNPPPGTVFLDGVDVRHVPLRVLRGAIGFVPQEPFLFGASLAENIAFGVSGSEPGRDTIERAGAAARLDKDLPLFPQGYDTVVGERGITLSGGQKQRTAIARALAVDPKVLVLDDALSAVDTYTEDEILGRLGGIMRERTSILVSHRISTVRGADQILVLDDGAIVERGTHDSLVRANGMYAALYRKQLLEDEVRAAS